MTVRTGAGGDFVGLSTDVKPTASIRAATRFYEADTRREYIWAGDERLGATTDWHPIGRNSGGLIAPSAYQADLTMGNDPQTIALATGVKLGGGVFEVLNKGVSGEGIRFTFGTSAANAEANLTITGTGATAVATTGDWVGSVADGYNPRLARQVPSNATHVSVMRDTGGDTQSVSTMQGV